MTEEVEVSVWKYTGTDWAIVSGATYERLEFEPRHQDVGVWSMTLRKGTQSDAIQPGRLITTNFRGDLRTWTFSPDLGITTTNSEDGRLTVTAGGFDALSMLGWVTAWPSPSAAITAQSQTANYPSFAETNILNIISDNFKNRAGFDVIIPASLSRGPVIISQPRFDNVLEEVLRMAVRAGLGVRLGLVPTSVDTRAELTLSIYQPRDRTVRVRMSASDGSLGSWELRETPPTYTRAIVGGAGEGAGQYLRTVTSPGSTDATVWGGHREVFVDGPETFDNPPLDEAGQNELADTGARSSLTMEADEPLGQRAFEAFTVGDMVTAAPHPDVELQEVVSAIRVVHETGNPEITPVFGDPDSGDPDGQSAELIRALRREVRYMRINRKRGAVTG